MNTYVALFRGINVGGPSAADACAAGSVEFRRAQARYVGTGNSAQCPGVVQQSVKGGGQ